MSGEKLLLLDLHTIHFCVNFLSTFYILLNLHTLHHTVSKFRGFTPDDRLSHASVHTRALFITYLIPGYLLVWSCCIKLHGIIFLLSCKQLSVSKGIPCYQFASVG